MSVKIGIFLLLCPAALVVVLGTGCSEDPLDPAQGGSVVRVRLEPFTLQADWTLTGPEDFRLSGTGDLRLTNRTAGAYSVTWGDLPGWTVPIAETLTLAAGDSVVFVGGYASADWHRQESGTRESLMAVSFIDADVGTVVGLNGTILRTTDGGATWTAQDSGTREHLYGVDLADANTGVAVGTNSTILVTGDGGATWVPRRTAFLSDLTGVEMRDEVTGMAVGRHGTYYRTNDAGETWDPQNVYSRWRYINGKWVVTYYRLTDTELFAISYDPAHRITVVGADGFITRSGINGTYWFPDSTSTSFRHLTGVDCPTEQSRFAVGAGGTILHSVDSGITWGSLASGTDAHLYAVDFVDDDAGTVVGLRGTILRTTDGGTTWTNQVAGTFRFLLDIEFIDAATGTIVGDDGVILRTTTGGGPGGPSPSRQSVPKPAPGDVLPPGVSPR